MKLSFWPPIRIYHRDETGEHCAEIGEVDFPTLPHDKVPPADDLVSSIHNRTSDGQCRRVPMALLRELDLEAGLRSAFREACGGFLSL